MYYKKIAIINDNPVILNRFLETLTELGLSDLQFKTFCSLNTDLNKYRHITNSVEPINLKNNYSKLIENNFDLIISLHCKQIFPENLVSATKCINVHPGYNPINRGWYPQVFAIVNGLELGATIHEMDRFVDHGKVIDRQKIQLNSWDTSYTAYNRIVDTEIMLIKKNIINILDNNYQPVQPENEGNYFSIKEFKNLCKINLSEKSDYRTMINRLRALTHGDYNNAWFVDEKTGKKVFVSINLRVEE
jgi:methionyl-tRNA formyltransferase